MDVDQPSNIPTPSASPASGGKKDHVDKGGVPMSEWPQPMK